MSNYYDELNKPRRIPVKNIPTNVKNNKVIQEKIPKLYWSIGEVAKELQVPASKLRYWESYFNYSIHRQKSKPNRSFSASDIVFFKKLQELVEKERYTLEGAKIQLIKLNLLKDDNNKQG